MVDLTLAPDAAQIEKRLLTVDEYLALQAQSDVALEIIDGEIRGKNMPMGGGLIHASIGVNVSTPLRLYMRKHPQHGIVFGDNVSFLMFNVGQGLKHSFVPDVGFLRANNIPADWSPDKPHPGVPNLAIEVVSPGDTANEISEKVKTYLDKGTEQVWVLYPINQTAHQYFQAPDETIIARVYTGAQPIDTSALFPNIDALTPNEIFDLPAWLPTQK